MRLPFECLRPFALYEVIPVIEQKELGIIEVGAHPNWSVQRRGEALASLNRRYKNLLERQRSGQS